MELGLRGKNLVTALKLHANSCVCICSVQFILVEPSFFFHVDYFSEYADDADRVQFQCYTITSTHGTAVNYFTFCCVTSLFYLLYYASIMCASFDLMQVIFSRARMDAYYY